MSDQYTAKQLATALSVADRTVRIRANKESWPFELKKGRGGKTPHYLLTGLPADVQTKVIACFGTVKDTKMSTKGKNAGQFLAQTDQAVQRINLETKQSSLKEFAGLQGTAKVRASVKVQLISAAKVFQKRSGLPKVKAWTLFCDHFNQGHESIDPSLFKHHKTISYISLARWEKAFNTKGVTSLAGNYGHKKNSGIINSNPELLKYCLALIQEYPHIKGERIHELLTAEFGTQYEIPCARSCRRWLQKWKTENQALYMSMFDPSAWQNTRMVAFGNMSAEITRINQLWEFDSTPADIMLTDGRYSIVGVLDVFTRRVKLVLKPTSNAAAIATLIRRAILDWGLPEVARTDNGADYLSNHITTVWGSLDIENDITNPYSGWEKPYIERFFRTFSHGIAELLQGYIGHNVVDRERISSRLTFEKRLMEKREKGAAKVGIEVNLNSKEFEKFMHQWVEHHYHHTTHSNLKCTPFEQYTQHQQTIKRLEDERVLDVLLAPVPGQKGFRTITKSNGISVEGGHYIHAELGAYIGERVFCRWNEKDIGKIFVFHALHEHYICEAVNAEIADNDISMGHAMEAKRIQRAQLKDQRKAFKTMAAQQDVSQAAQKYLDYRSTQNGGLNAFPKPAAHVSTTATQSASQVITSQNKKHEYTTEQKEDFEKRRQQIEAAKKVTAPTFDSPLSQARYLTESSLSRELLPTEKAFLHQFRRNNKACISLLDTILSTKIKSNGAKK
jgi:hypothetical protein